MTAIIGLRRRVYPGHEQLGELARDTDDALRRGSLSIQELERRLAILEAAGGGGSVSYGSPVALSVGGGNVDGVATTVPRSDHKHSLPAFGSGAGTFCEGNDARLSNARTPTAHAASHEGGSDPIDVTALDGYPGGTSTFLRADGTFSSTPGGGAYSRWDPEAPPVSPHACDDEFDGLVLDPKWTAWDHSASQTRTLDTTRKMFQQQQTGNGTVRAGGIYQAVPASEFAVYARFSIAFPPTNASGASIGLMVGDDLSNVASDFRAIDVNGNNTTGLQVSTRTWSAYNGSQTSVTTRTYPGGGYLRLRVNGTACASDYSPDGVAFWMIASVTLGFTPVHFGISGASAENAVQVTSWAHWFRVFSGAGTSAFNGTSIGRYI